RRRESIAGALRLVVIRRVPLELAHQLKQAFLPSARNEFLQCLGHGGLFRPLAADFERLLDQIGIYGKIGGHVCTSTHDVTQNSEFCNSALALAGARWYAASRRDDSWRARRA